MFSLGLEMKFIVFSVSVCSVVLVLCLVSEEIIIIGSGCRCIRFFRNVSLFMCGIFMFRVIMFGSRCLIFLCVNSGLVVVLIMLMVGLLDRIFVSICCMMVELLMIRIW